MSATTLKGENGAVVTIDTTAITGNFEAIQVIDTATFSLLTADNWTGGSLTGVAISTGMVLFGRFSAYTLTSGKVIAYNRGVL